MARSTPWTAAAARLLGVRDDADNLGGPGRGGARAPSDTRVARGFGGDDA